MAAQSSVGPAVMAARVEDRGVAILAADIASYSGLARTDKVGTVAHLNALRQQLVDPTIAEYRGRVVRLTDDRMLVEFVSAVDAVECAVAIQKGVAEREAHVAEARRMQYRFGVNLRSISVKGDDTFGQQVKDAARLATLAEPGGICIARPVYDEVKSELKLKYEHHSDWMHVSLMSTNTPDSWPSTMDLIEVSAVKISAAAITGQSTHSAGLLRKIKRLLDRSFH